eukprot:TRINITY_DN48597_c0_g1_i1.p1 TRINITY_DN48597_c0_g1~~TRINITY_DN48597_c0_g1_i1.p1  ORF type:complete len:160 (-),score=41.96 TRINITY_DN48597_c0_g1_i1:277-756(-)
MSCSGSDAEENSQGRGKLVQRHKRELKELHEQKKLEATKLTSFAKSKRDHEKIKVRAEKREFEEKYRKLEEEMKLKHAQELAAVSEGGDGKPEVVDGVPPVSEMVAVHVDPTQAALEDAGEGTRKSKQQIKRDRLAKIEKELREGSDVNGDVVRSVKIP